MLISSEPFQWLYLESLQDIPCDNSNQLSLQFQFLVLYSLKRSTQPPRPFCHHYVPAFPKKWKDHSYYGSTVSKQYNRGLWPLQRLLLGPRNSSALPLNSWHLGYYWYLSNIPPRSELHLYSSFLQTRNKSCGKFWKLHTLLSTWRVWQET